MPDLRVGISGWRYPRWRGVFYPPGLVQRRELEYASRRMNSVELNGSFYSLQRPESYQRWYEETPPGFLFAVKGARFITHMRKLRNAEPALANFFASGVLKLREKLGPILWQLPPQLGFDAGRIESFLDQLPYDTRAAAAWARRHEPRMEGRAWTRTDRNRPLRHAIEFRHDSYLSPEFFTLLRARNVAAVFADTAGRWPYTEDLTADFVYVRLHGSTELYASAYTDAELDRWAERLRAWTAGREPADAKRVSETPAPPPARDAYVYFDNDAKIAAPFDALRLAERLGLPTGSPEAPPLPDASPRQTRNP